MIEKIYKRKRKDENLKNQIEMNNIKIIITTLERRRSQRILEIKTNPKVESSLTVNPSE